MARLAGHRSITRNTATEIMGKRDKSARMPLDMSDPFLRVSCKNYRVSLVFYAAFCSILLFCSARRSKTAKHKAGHLPCTSIAWVGVHEPGLAWLSVIYLQKNSNSSPVQQKISISPWLEFISHYRDRIVILRALKFPLR